MTQTISEYGVIKKTSDYPFSEDSFLEIFMADQSFSLLKTMAFSGENDLLMTYSTQKGKEQIRLKNYVGVIALKNGTQIEILPKSTANSAKEARKILLKMLRILPNSPYKSLTDTYLRVCHLPIFEIFVTVFLDELEKLLLQGLGRSFETIEGNQPFLKGKLLITENLRKNSNNLSNFFTSFDEFRADIAPNRVLKLCLQILDNQISNVQNKQRILQNLLLFDEVNLPTNLAQDFLLSQQNKLLLARYEKLLNWAKIFIHQQSFLPFSGDFFQLSLVFPVEVLFENYVGKGFKKYFSDKFEVSLQDRHKYLIENHLTAAKFRLIPDILLKNEEEIFVFDTKWKLIDGSKSKQNYEIQQADLYQMYAYGKKFNAQKLFLIYPSNPNFKETLQVFNYEANMHLYIVAFDLMNDFSVEIEKIKALIDDVVENKH